MRHKCNGDTKIANLFCHFFTRGEIKNNHKTQNEMRKIEIAKKNLSMAMAMMAREDM